MISKSNQNQWFQNDLGLNQNHTNFDLNQQNHEVV